MSDRIAGASRQSFVARAMLLVREIDEHFATFEHWNETHPNEEPIDPDPDGELRALRGQMREFIKREGGDDGE